MPTVSEKSTEVLEGEGSADWMMPLKDSDEYALVTETSEIKAIEP
jgi:hypothetical protein